MNADQEGSTIEYAFGDDCDSAAESYTPTELEVESVWTKTNVAVLLEECLKKQKEFHNTRHRRSKFFSAIRDSMLKRGLVFNAKTLERKFYNLKKHYFPISKSREEPTTWPYHEQMMQMFAEELEIDEAPTMASLYPDIVPTQRTSTLLEIEREVEHSNEKDEELQHRNSEEESQWGHKTVMAFLDECCKRKHDLKDPKIRRRKIFGEIRRRLRLKGYFFLQESLDRKLRNMKKQFQVVTEAAQNNKLIRNGKRRKITWPYYEKLREIYGEEMERDVQWKNAESQGEVTESPAMKFRPIAPKIVEPVTVASDDVSPPPQNAQAADVPRIPSHDDNTPPVTEASTSHRDPKHDDEKLKFIRQIVAFEERRTIVTEQMLAEMRESNKIREKRLEFSRIKLEYALRRRRKTNGSI